MGGDKIAFVSESTYVVVFCIYRTLAKSAKLFCLKEGIKLLNLFQWYFGVLL